MDGHFVGGDIIFQLVMFLFLLMIPVVIAALVILTVKRGKRLKNIEEKLDVLMNSHKEQ
ncbi:hypothetical protein [Falsibacillus pallidus]|uniref:hypothetical protein n=1 Tax=Falsibacillus pallidus TaxID=493781 RepID=UPI003D99605A